MFVLGLGERERESGVGNVLLGLINMPNKCRPHSQDSRLDDDRPQEEEREREKGWIQRKGKFNSFPRWYSKDVSERCTVDNASGIYLSPCRCCMLLFFLTFFLNFLKA